MTSWSNDDATEDLATLAPGDYTVTVTDAGACSGIETFTVSEATAINIVANITNENCGDQEGVISLAPTGGVEPFTYLWNNGATSSTIDELSQGNYSVTVTDLNLCTETANFNITNYVGNCIPDCDLAYTYEHITDETCGQTNGAIDLTIFTSFSPYTVSWDNGATDEDLNSLSANDYTITLTDAEGCELIKTYTVANQTSGLEVLNTEVIDETCGNGQGEINVTVNGGALPYTFNWDNGATTEDLTNLNEGDYNLTVTDANGCAVNVLATVTNEAGDLVLTWGGVINETCGNTQGNIDILVEGGNPFHTGGGGGFDYYLYQWSNGATSEDLLNLSAGNYSCIITDEDGCQISTPDYIVENEGGTLAIDHIDLDNEICNNSLGEIELIISGGTTPYTFSWNSGETTQDIFNLSAGTYNNTITDSNGCLISTGNLTIINESGTLALGNMNSTNELCNNNSGEINLTITGGTTPYNYLWNTGAVAENLNGLQAGSYSCEITDANGCLVIVNTTINNDNGTIAVSNTIITDENCGNSDGTVDITITGAASPINFNWNNGDATEDLLNLSAGTYNCFITDAMGCETNANTIVDNSSGDLDLDNSIVTNEQCGDANGSIQLVVSGSATPLTFAWSNGATTQNIDNLVAGTYSCIITDNNACSINSEIYTINNTSSTILVTNIDVTNETCGSVNGAINLTISGGDAPIVYNWSNGATTEDITNIVAGTYTYIITDNSGCSINGSAKVINDAGDLAITSFIKVDEICGNGNGSIDITVNGASPFNYNWSNGATTEDIVGLSVGSFNVTISDDNGCEITSSNYNILNDAGAFELVSKNITNEHCNDGSGAINIELANGTTPINYAWSNSETTEDITGLSQGVYSCVATDNNGCELNYFATVENIEGNITVSNEIIENETCGNSNGSISIDVSGGSSPYNFAWSNGETTEDISNLNVGNYNCVITDDIGCSTNYNTTIEDIGGDFAIISTEVINENCNNNQGEINITLTGGTQPYIFAWDNGATTEDLTGLSAGTYNLTVTETTGCSIQTSVEVINTIGTFVIDNTNITDENCGQGDGAIDITYSGASEPVIFNWSNGSPFEDIDNLSSGNYSLTATDNNGCIVNDAYFVDNITNGFELINSVVINENCGNAGGSIDLTITGGTTPYTITWNNGASTEDLSNLPAGAYSCEITDAVGCIINFSADIINETGGLAVNLDNTINDNCNTSVGELDINATGGTSPYSFSWNIGATTQNITGLTAGTYIVTVTDNVGCSITGSYEVGNNGANFDFGFIDLYNDQCSQGNGAVDFNATPAGVYTYELDGLENFWSDGQFLGLTAGEYTISIVEGACRVDSLITIGNESTFNVSNITVTDENCGDQQGSIDISINPSNPPYSYLWSNGATTQDITGLSAGTYTCEITKLNDACTDYITVVVEGNSTMDIATDVSNENCGQTDGEITLFLSGGETPYIFDWSNGGTTQNITNLSEGTYTCIITDNLNCSITISEEITNETNGLVINLLDITSDYCDAGNGIIDIIPTGGVQPYNFNWSNGETTEDISGLTVGNYTIELTDNVGCQVSGTYEVTSSMGFALIDITDDYCNLGQGDIFFQPIIMGNYTFELDGLSQNNPWFTGVSAGEHTISIIDGTCRVDSIITVENQATFFTNLNSVTNDICSQEIGAIDLQVGPASASYTYDWSNGETTQDILNLAAGIYTCQIVKTNDGCTDNVEVEILNDNGTLNVTSTLNNDECSQSIGLIELTVTSNGTYTVLWNNDETTDIIENLASGEYSVVVTETSSNCQINDNFTIESIGDFSVTEVITNSTCETCDDGAIDLSLTPAGTYTFNWDNGDDTEDINGLLPSDYSVNITNDFGCSFDEIYTIEYGVSVNTLKNISIKIYPNPVENILNVKYDFNKFNSIITITNISGSIMYKTNVYNTNGKINIKTDKFADGIYFIQIKSEDFSEAFKFIKYTEL